MVKMLTKQEPDIDTRGNGKTDKCGKAVKRNRRKWRNGTKRHHRQNGKNVKTDRAEIDTGGKMPRLASALKCKIGKMVEWRHQ